MARDDGGPAYPLPAEWNGPELINSAHPGISLRDYFAGRALIGLVEGSFSAKGQTMLKEARDQFKAKGVGEVFAKAAYEYADAMLDERKEGK